MASDDESDDATRTSARRRGRLRNNVLACWLVFFVLAACWSLATPLYASPDAPNQVIKAVAVAEGQFVGTPVRDPEGPRTFVTVPRSYVSGLHYPACFVEHRDVTPSCATPLDTSTAPLRTAIYVGRYPPLYYAIVGTVSRIASGTVALRAMALVSAALCSFFLALATGAILTWSRRPLLLGLATAVTPEVLFLAGVVNPSGLEIAAALALWSTLLLLVLDDNAPPRPLVVIAGLAAATEALCRPLSPLWVVVTALIVLSLGGFARLRALVARRVVRVAAALVTLAGLLALAWIVHFHATDVQTVHGAAAHAIRGSYAGELWHRQPLYLEETIALFATNNLPAPGVAYLTWKIAAGGLLVVALVGARWRARIVLLAAAAAALLLPFAIVLSQAARRHGLIWQGRDGAPLTLGLLLLAGALAHLGQRRAWNLVGATAFTMLLAVTQLGAFVGTLNRYVVGYDQPFHFFGHALWHPPLPPLVLSALFAGALVAALAVLVAAVVHQPPAVTVEASLPDSAAKG